MSRGLGTTQRAILAVVTPGRYGDLAEIAFMVVNRPPTRSEYQSVRRAVRRLVALGVLETETDAYYGIEVFGRPTTPQ